MKLNFRKLGDGQPLIILHGLFGSSDNWQTVGKKFSEKGFSVYLVDQRNHGHSPHSSEHNYSAMADDLFDFINDEILSSSSLSLSPVLIGHSMGGKTAMQFALNHPEMLSKLIVVDISPKKYSGDNHDTANALMSLDLNKIKTRKEAEEKLSEKISDNRTKQFLLKNLFWIEHDKLAWRFNLKTLSEQIEKMSAGIISENVIEKPVLFIRGEKSNYILPEDEPLIKTFFPNAEIKTAPGSGHWVHVDNPEWLFKTCMEFLK